MSHSSVSDSLYYMSQLACIKTHCPKNPKKKKIYFTPELRKNGGGLLCLLITEHRIEVSLLPYCLPAKDR